MLRAGVAFRRAPHHRIAHQRSAKRSRRSFEQKKKKTTPDARMRAGTTRESSIKSFISVKEFPTFPAFPLKPQQHAETTRRFQTALRRRRQQGSYLDLVRRLVGVAESQADRRFRRYILNLRWSSKSSTFSLWKRINGQTNGLARS